jgi:hypothetical protein
VEDPDDCGQLILQSERHATFAQGQAGILQGLEHAERLVELEHDLRGHRILRTHSPAGSASNSPPITSAASRSLASKKCA